MKVKFTGTLSNFIKFMSKKRERKKLTPIDPESEQGKRFKEMQRKIRSGEMKIEEVSQEQTEYLEPYIRQILEVTADLTDTSGIANAYVTDLSSLGDFFFGFSEEDEAEIMKEMSEELGVEINAKECLTEIARKMAGLV